MAGTAEAAAMGYEYGVVIDNNMPYKPGRRVRVITNLAGRKTSSLTQLGELGRTHTLPGHHSRRTHLLPWHD